jgi:hypothetical protein
MLALSFPSTVMSYMGIVAEYFQDLKHLLDHERTIVKEEHLKLQQSLNVKGDAVDAVLQHQDKTPSVWGAWGLAFQ